MSWVAIQPGDPHNDQMAARARDELDRHITYTRGVLEQVGGQAEATVMVAVALTEGRDAFPRDLLAAVLAAALVRLAGPAGGATP